ncbi:MAG: Fic family protein [Bacteroides sp.]
MNRIQYIDYNEVLEVYRKMIDASGGGLKLTNLIRYEGGIRSTLDFVQNDDYNPTFTDKLTYLVFKFCSGHYFYDGNKRIALTLGTYFLHKNDYLWNACVFMKQFEAIVYHIAASHIDQDLFLRITTAFMKGEDYDESLKIDIAHAMGGGQEYNQDH